MNNVTTEDIQNCLKISWKYINKNFNSQAILGVFVVDKANFGVAQTTGDITIVAVTFPSIRDMAVGCPFSKPTLLTDKFGFPIMLTSFCSLMDEIFDKNSVMAEIFFTPYYILNKMYQKSFSVMQTNTEAAANSTRLNACLSFKEDIVHKVDELTEQLTAVFELYLQFQDGAQEKFFGSLTKTEEKALIFILECIGEEGIVSISEAIKASGISRPVFTSLFDKLERYKSAEIKNMGVKGTYINFYDHILSKFEIN